MRQLVLLFAMILGLAFLSEKPRKWPLGLDRWLTPREWQLAFSLLSIAIFALTLLYANLAYEFPSELFIYGRF
jgi:hypothetical protein